MPDHYFGPTEAVVCQYGAWLRNTSRCMRPAWRVHNGYVQGTWAAVFECAFGHRFALADRRAKVSGEVAGPLAKLVSGESPGLLPGPDAAVGFEAGDHGPYQTMRDIVVIRVPSERPVFGAV